MILRFGIGKKGAALKGVGSVYNQPQLDNLFKFNLIFVSSFYVTNMGWVVSNYHKKYLKDLGVTNNIEAYIQSRVEL